MYSSNKLHYDPHLQNTKLYTCNVFTSGEMRTTHGNGGEKGHVLIIKLSNVNSGIHDVVIHVFFGRK